MKTQGVTKNEPTVAKENKTVSVFTAGLTPTGNSITWELIYILVRDFTYCRGNFRLKS